MVGEVVGGREEGGARCGVCRCATGGEVVREGGGVYHPTCANYWVNCVHTLLPLP